MAFYSIVNSTSYKLKYFDEKAWEGKGRILPYILTEIYPPTACVLSKLEKEDTSWFYGKVVGEEGKGCVQATYPYTSEKTDKVLTPKNINMQIFPYITFKAIPLEGYVFKYWCTDWNGLGEKLSTKNILQVGPGMYGDITTFFAYFVEKE